MGRGQQMSIYDMENPGVSASGKDFRSMSKRRVLVALLAFFLPIVLTSSYMYYSTPDASTEAMMFFQRRPFSSFLPHKGGTNTSNFDNDANGSDTRVEPNIEDTKNTTDNLGTKPVECSTEAPSEALVEDVQAKAPSEAMAEDREAEKLDPSETGLSANETSSTFGFPVQDQANVTTTELQNPTSPVVNATTVESDASNQSQVDDNPNNDQQSEPIVIAMDGQGLSITTNVENKGVCDLAKGSWVPDTRPPQYTNTTCQYIQAPQNCMKNGRPDTGYMYWKWQPEQCELPRIDAPAFLTAMRDRSMAFVGDSIARNQFQSLLCLLSQSEKPDHTYQAPGDKDNVYVFRSHNFTIAVYWSPYLVHVENKLTTWPDNSTQIVQHIHVDELDEAWVERVPGVDILQISTGQWWFKRGLFLQSGQAIGGHSCDGWRECTKEIGFAEPYRTAMHNVLRGSLSVPGYTGTTILRTFSPDHFEGGNWQTGGKCVRTSPGGVPVTDMTKWMYEIQIEVFQNVTGALSASDKNRIRLLNITNLSQIRADGHPDAYRNFQPFSKESKLPVQRDCLHWCLPGPIDTWNDLLVKFLRDAVFR